MLIPRGVEGAPRPSSWEGSWQVKGLSDPSVPPAPRPCPEEVWVAWAFQSKPRGFARKAARCGACHCRQPTSLQELTAVW